MEDKVKVSYISGAAAVLAAVVALASAYYTNKKAQEFSSIHEPRIEELRAELSLTHERELTLLRTELTQSYENQKPFLEMQMKYYFEAIEVTSKIANSRTDANTEELQTRFWELYWGSLGAVEDSEVASAMVKFGKLLSSSAQNDGKLKQSSIALAHACRDSLQKSWKIDLGAVGDRPINSE